jgi:hypothetical protein
LNKLRGGGGTVEDGAWLKEIGHLSLNGIYLFSFSFFLEGQRKEICYVASAHLLGYTHEI